MFVYVRMNLIKRYWEMCSENSRADWKPIIDYSTNYPIVSLDQDIAKYNAKIRWGGEIDDYSVLMALPLRSVEDTHGYHY